MREALSIWLRGNANVRAFITITATTPPSSGPSVALPGTGGAGPHVLYRQPQARDLAEVEVTGCGSHRAFPCNLSGQVGCG